MSSTGWLNDVPKIIILREDERIPFLIGWLTKNQGLSEQERGRGEERQSLKSRENVKWREGGREESWLEHSYVKMMWVTVKWFTSLSCNCINNSKQKDK